MHAAVFGPGRFARTAYRIREAAKCGPLVALTAWAGETLAGAIQFTAITVGGRRGAALLGPLVIAPAFQGKGCGMRLITQGMAGVRECGHEVIILVGDLPYYRRAGFCVIPQGQIMLPGPADPARFLAAELVPDALARFRGMVAADNERAPDCHQRAIEAQMRNPREERGTSQGILSAQGLSREALSGA